MDYEKITADLIGKIMNEYNLENDYQKFLDFLTEYGNLNETTADDLSFEVFQKYLDKEEK